MGQHSLFTDGGARGNPGPSAIGALLYDARGELLDTRSEYIGVATNNIAEYKALIAGLNLAIENEVEELKCHLDSELVVMQMNGAYRVKEKTLKLLWEEAKKAADKIPEVKFVHVRRESNAEADALVNAELDAKFS